MPDPNPLQLLAKKYGWVHLSLGLFGNAMFFVGSIMFLPSLHGLKPYAVWLFIFGSCFMLVGAVGRLLVDVLDRS